MKKSDPANGSMFPLTPGPSPRWGEGKVNTRVSSLAPIGGEGGPPDGGPGEGAIGEHSEFFHTF